MQTEADFWSRSPDKHSWKMHPQLFQFIDRLWGPHTVHRFANCQNTQLRCFNSRYWEPLSEGVDALAQRNWGMENNFDYPPFCLMSRVLNLIVQQKAFATVIAALWKAQHWFQTLARLSIAAPLKIPNSHRVCKPMGIGIPEPCRNRKWQIYAWRLYGGKI